MPITADEFRDVLRFHASGVTIVTVRSGATRHGLTVTAFSSISADPPLVSVAVDRRHDAHALLQTDGAVFAVNVLAEDQQALSERFAFAKEGDRFELGDWRTATTGAPILADALAWIDCRIAGRHPAGSHVIYLGEVEACAAVRPHDRPLTYWNRDYHQVRSDT